MPFSTFAIAVFLSGTSLAIAQEAIPIESSEPAEAAANTESAGNERSKAFQRAKDAKRKKLVQQKELNLSRHSTKYDCAKISLVSFVNKDSKNCGLKFVYGSDPYDFRCGSGAGNLRVVSPACRGVDLSRESQREFKLPRGCEVGFSFEGNSYCHCAGATCANAEPNSSAVKSLNIDAGSDVAQ